MLAHAQADTLGAMHTCLTLTNSSGHSYIEREVSGLMAALRGYCDAIHSCDIGITGPSGDGPERCWRIELRIRVCEEIARVSVRTPEGRDPQRSLSSALADAYARARIQLSYISAQHGDCCAHGSEQTSWHLEECA
jgi:hypothetical protein